jgi:hypothetical protein
MAEILVRGHLKMGWRRDVEEVPAVVSQEFCTPEHVGFAPHSAQPRSFSGLERTDQ